MLQTGFPLVYDEWQFYSSEVFILGLVVRQPACRSRIVEAATCERVHFGREVGKFANFCPCWEIKAANLATVVFQWNNGLHLNSYTNLACYQESAHGFLPCETKGRD